MCLSPIKPVNIFFAPHISDSKRMAKEKSLNSMSSQYDKIQFETCFVKFKEFLQDMFCSLYSAMCVKENNEKGQIIYSLLIEI